MKVAVCPGFRDTGRSGSLQASARWNVPATSQEAPKVADVQMVDGSQASILVWCAYLACKSRVAFSRGLKLLDVHAGVHEPSAEHRCVEHFTQHARRRVGSRSSLAGTAIGRAMSAPKSRIALSKCPGDATSSLPEVAPRRWLNTSRAKSRVIRCR